MSMFSEFSTLIQTTFRTATRSVESVGKGIDIVNDYVDNAHKSMTRNAAKQAIHNTAKAHKLIQDELAADPKLNTLFEKLEAEWDLPKSEWARPERKTETKPKAKK